VALAVGYQSLSQFIATFRQITGQLPSEVRRHA
jgi:AraC-like DNA-binding protein